MQLELIEIAELAEQLEPLLARPAADAEREKILAGYSESLERLTEVAESIELTGLAKVGQLLDDNQQQLAEQDLSEELRRALPTWPALVTNYLNDLENDQADAAQALVDYLAQPCWPHPLVADQTAPLLAELGRPQLTDVQPPGEERQRHATHEDVLLSVPDEVNPDLLDSLLAELPNQTAEFSEAIQQLAAGNGGRDEVDQAQRLAHTLKGAANTVGVPGIANLTHHTEDILVALAKHDALPSAPLAATLVNVADCLETMSEALLGMSAPPDDAFSVLQSVLDWANQIDREGIPVDDQAPPLRTTIAGEPVASAAQPSAAQPSAAQPVAAQPSAAQPVAAHRVRPSRVRPQPVRPERVRPNRRRSRSSNPTVTPRRRCCASRHR